MRFGSASWFSSSLYHFLAVCTGRVITFSGLLVPNLVEDAELWGL